MKFMNFLGKLLFVLSIAPWVILAIIFVCSGFESAGTAILMIFILIFLFVIIGSCVNHRPTKEQQEKFEKYYDDWVNIRRK